MMFKDDLRNTTGAVLTKSQEIFEKIFAQATRELKIGMKPRLAAQKPGPAPSAEAPRTEGKKPKIAMGSEKSIPTYKASEKVKGSLRPKPKGQPSPKKGPRLLRAGLLFVLLLLLAGFAADHFAILDLSVIPDLLGLGPKQVVQAPIPRKQPAKPPEKLAVPLKQPQAQEKAQTTESAPSIPTPPAMSKEEKLVELETPTTVAPLKEEKLRVEDKPASAPATDTSKSAEVAVRKESQALPAQAEILEKPSVSTVAPPKPPGTPQYPYSVYLGSFKAAEAVNKAISDFQEKGLSGYWVKVDLGDKGVWYRFFTGYFRTKEEAAKYIREHNIHGAEPGITKYANLIGTYASEKEAENEKQMLVSAGFCPYLVKNDEGNVYLLSGAFDRKEYAENGRAMLASKGIRSETIER